MLWRSSETHCSESKESRSCRLRTEHPCRMKRAGMPKPAARLGDSTMHGSPLLGACATTVLIGGKPAWRGTDQHTCPIPNAPPPVCDGAPHGPGITAPIPDGGLGMVIIQGKPAARLGDLVTEPHALVPLPPPN